MATRLIALFILALSLLPIADLLPGGEHDAEYLARLVDWAYGLALCGGLGGLAAFVVRSRRRAAAAAGAGAPDILDASIATPSFGAGSAGTGFTLLIAAVALALYLVIALVVFSGRPITIDEIVQVIQARWYVEGQLAQQTAPLREFFSTLHMVDVGDVTYSQFPAGGPAMLALGSLVGAEWIVGPIVGALSVALFARLLALLEPEASRRWHRASVALFALAPFGAFMFGSHMNHATTLFWLLFAIVALGIATARDDVHPIWGAIVGFGLGAAATIRPLDGVAFALPAAAWLLWRARRGGRPLATLLLSGVGIAVPLALLLWVNSRTTGHPLLFGYDLLWGPKHAIGFHVPPWGTEHTPLRGIELISLYFTRLSVYLFETPFPALLPAAIALWWRPALRPLDRYLFASGALLVVGYWAYWHDGFWLGPRFMLPLLPLLVLWSARATFVIRDRLPSGSLGRVAAGVTLVTGAAYAIVTILLVRAPQYRNGMSSMRIEIEQESARAGVRDALVLVKESWGAQLVARMWALGVPRSDTEGLYQRTDACVLETAIGALEAAGLHGEAARARLVPLQADSSRLVKSTRSPDDTQRMLPGLRYSARCEARIAEDQLGFSLLAPLRLAKDGNVYARWFPGREVEIARYYPGRRVYVLERASPALGAPFIWRPFAP